MVKVPVWVTVTGLLKRVFLTMPTLALCRAAGWAATRFASRDTREQSHRFLAQCEKGRIKRGGKLWRASGIVNLAVSRLFRIFGRGNVDW